VSQSKLNSSEKEWSGVPILFDEVFTGLYRLGRFNCSSYLQAHPDIVVNAKLLTGGIVPLCTTTASQSIFDAFLSSDKSDALLHGHSYTAHAIGCNVAVESLNEMMAMEKGQVWNEFKSNWDQEGKETSEMGPRPVWSMWSASFVNKISQKASVDHVIALGSVLAIALKDEAGAGKFAPLCDFIICHFLTIARLHIDSFSNTSPQSPQGRGKLVCSFPCLG
jgi:dethiobiotin synthetase/adenosylmethionine--8-amino-7-oxononanoate aminotransferase